MNSFKNWGRFQYSRAYGGSYTPKVGDILYIGVSTTDSNHVGIVTSVTSSTVTIIDGNSSNQVKRTTHSLTSSSIIGYGTPAYNSQTHNWQAYGARYRCSNCGMITSSIPGIS